MMQVLKLIMDVGGETCAQIEKKFGTKLLGMGGGGGARFPRPL